MWEGVGDRTELQHIDPHSYGHNSVSFLFSWAAQPGAWGPSLSGTWSSFQHLLSNWPEHPVARVIYIIIWCPLFFLRASQFCTQFNPSTVKVISRYSSTGCTYYLHRCISYFDSLSGSEVNIQQINMEVVQKVHRLTKILSWNKTKWGSFFNIVPLVVHILFPSVLQWMDPIGKMSSTADMTSSMNFSVYLHVYIFIIKVR